MAWLTRVRSTSSLPMSPSAGRCFFTKHGTRGGGGLSFRGWLPFWYILRWFSYKILLFPTVSIEIDALVRYPVSSYQYQRLTFDLIWTIDEWEAKAKHLGSLDDSIESIEFRVFLVCSVEIGNVAFTGKWWVFTTGSIARRGWFSGRRSQYECFSRYVGEITCYFSNLDPSGLCKRCVVWKYYTYHEVQCQQKARAVEEEKRLITVTSLPNTRYRIDHVFWRFAVLTWAQTWIFPCRGVGRLFIFVPIDVLPCAVRIYSRRSCVSCAVTIVGETAFLSDMNE